MKKDWLRSVDSTLFSQSFYVRLLSLIEGVIQYRSDLVQIRAT